MITECPCCGAPFELPEELRNLHLKHGAIRLLIKLYRGGGRTITYSSLEMHRATLQCYISVLRTAFYDAGVPWEIISHFDHGYRLVKIEPFNETSRPAKCAKASHT